LKEKNQQPKDIYAYSLKNEDSKQIIVKISKKIVQNRDEKSKN
jgi:hypothetical protein